MARYVSIMPRTSGSVYDFWDKRNPGPSGEDDLNASELLAAQVEDSEEEDGDEEPNDVDILILDDQVGFFTHYNESNNIDIRFVLEAYK